MDAAASAGLARRLARLERLVHGAAAAGHAGATPCGTSVSSNLEACERTLAALPQLDEAVALQDSVARLAAAAAPQPAALPDTTAAAAARLDATAEGLAAFELARGDRDACMASPHFGDAAALSGRLETAARVAAAQRDDVATRSRRLRALLLTYRRAVLLLGDKAAAWQAQLADMAAEDA